MRKRHQGTTIWELATALLVRGHYQHPVPPDPLEELWQRHLLPRRLDHDGQPPWLVYREDLRER